MRLRSVPGAAASAGTAMRIAAGAVALRMPVFEFEASDLVLVMA
jgi:hypothetical protein